jgi:hypothetical protein
MQSREYGKCNWCMGSSRRGLTRGTACARILHQVISTYPSIHLPRRRKGDVPRVRCSLTSTLCSVVRDPFTLTVELVVLGTSKLGALGAVGPASAASRGADHGRPSWGRASQDTLGVHFRGFRGLRSGEGRSIGGGVGGLRD